ncbi:hypothetical protein pb186bvf_008961 [Paramecium bursaria]
MYLPTFYKMGFETFFFKTRRIASCGPPVLLWAIWTTYPNLYNMIYTDFYPPPMGVERRKQE